jgi:mannose-6-phosphate isomerase
MKDAQEQDDDHFSIDESAPYAELWLGTHPSGMSRVTVPTELLPDSVVASAVAVKCSLAEYVQSNPDLHCGSPDAQDLSFLLKILSVRKVLSIQAHPDKALAQKLHAARPDVYKDPNHKPEMAIALSEKVRAMCGFRALPEIAQFLATYPELRTMMGEDMAQQIERAAAAALRPETTKDHTKLLLQNMFRNYLEVKAEIMEFLVERMVTRLRTMTQHSAVDKLILQLQEQFPGDCGIFSPLFFNIVELQQGQALFIHANEPHAYLSGEIIECMACSDNVVRAGLTPKLKDVDTLVSMLTYQCGMPEISSGEAVDEYCRRYCPPVEDFCMEIITIGAGQVYELPSVVSPSILLTLDGEANVKQNDVCSMDVSFGSAAFCSAQTTCSILAGPYGVRLTRAFTNVYHTVKSIQEE